MSKALEYHKTPPQGKLTVVPTKPCNTADDLSLAYSPGVAEPCIQIHKDPKTAYLYTAKANLVAVISNGTAVLGLGNIGPLASKPVMEGKAILFKRFANVDAFDLEINESDPKKIVPIIKSLEPTFGGINLEDIKAPDCFYIEEQLSKQMNIPLFHDDQHGTAIIIAAGLQNALELTNKQLPKAKIIFSGAGAAAIASANLLLTLGAKKSNIFMFDSKGLITKERKTNKYKAKFSQTSSLTLKQALKGADIFIGVSKGDLLTPDMIKQMATSPIIFAMANPTPEINYDLAKKTRPDCIVATGRSDFPNQVNNVLCFPFLFRAALDTRASKITLSMKHAAVHALANLAKEPVPKEVETAYNQTFAFSSEYILPKPFDPRVLPKVATAVARQAIKDSVATTKIKNLAKYEKDLTSLAKHLTMTNFCPR